MRHWIRGRACEHCSPDSWLDCCNLRQNVTAEGEAERANASRSDAGLLLEEVQCRTYRDALGFRPLDFAAAFAVSWAIEAEQAVARSRQDTCLGAK